MLGNDYLQNRIQTYQIYIQLTRIQMRMLIIYLFTRLRCFIYLYTCRNCGSNQKIRSSPLILCAMKIVQLLSVMKMYTLLIPCDISFFVIYVYILDLEELKLSECFQGKFVHRTQVAFQSHLRCIIVLMQDKN